MELKEGLWGGLPSELVERVLSFLPVLELCRLRSVCKGWDKLICNAEFHDLCEQNRKEIGYLTIIRHHFYAGDRTEVDRRSKRTTSFLELDSTRWYSLKPCGEVGAPRAVLRREMMSEWMSAMDHGVVCDVSVRDEKTVVFAISDLIARTGKELPESPLFINFWEDTPIIIIGADPVTRSYRVFVITDNEQQGRRIFVYESVTNEWRAVKSPPVHLGVREAMSAASFGGMLYVVFRLITGSGCQLLSYHLQEDVWKFYNLIIPQTPFGPGLEVSCNRLFVTMWISESSASEYGSERKFQLEVREVLVAENSSRMVAQLSTTQLVQIFGKGVGTCLDIGFGVPRCSSSKSCESLVVMSDTSKKLVSIDLASGSVVALPAPPAESGEGLWPVVASSMGYCTNLSLRSLSSPFLK